MKLYNVSMDVIRLGLFAVLIISCVLPSQSRRSSVIGRNQISRCEGSLKIKTETGLKIKTTSQSRFNLAVHSVLNEGTCCWRLYKKFKFRGIYTDINNFQVENVHHEKFRSIKQIECSTIKRVKTVRKHYPGTKIEPKENAKNQENASGNKNKNGIASIKAEDFTLKPTIVWPDQSKTNDGSKEVSDIKIENKITEIVIDEEDFTLRPTTVWRDVDHDNDVNNDSIIDDKNTEIVISENITVIENNVINGESNTTSEENVIIQESVIKDTEIHTDEQEVIHNDVTVTSNEIKHDKNATKTDEETKNDSHNLTDKSYVSENELGDTKSTKQFTDDAEDNEIKSELHKEEVDPETDDEQHLKSESENLIAASWIESDNETSDVDSSETVDNVTETQDTVTNSTPSIETNLYIDDTSATQNITKHIESILENERQVLTDETNSIHSQDVSEINSVKQDDKSTNEISVVDEDSAQVLTDETNSIHSQDVREDNSVKQDDKSTNDNEDSAPKKEGGMNKQYKDKSKHKKKVNRQRGGKNKSSKDKSVFGKMMVKKKKEEVAQSGKNKDTNKMISNMKETSKDKSCVKDTSRDDIKPHKAMNIRNITAKVTDVDTMEKSTTQAAEILKETDDTSIHVDTTKVPDISKKVKKIEPTVSSAITAPTQEDSGFVTQTTTEIPKVTDDTFTTNFTYNLEVAKHTDKDDIEATTSKTVEYEKITELNSYVNEIESVGLGETKPAHRPITVELEATDEDTDTDFKIKSTTEKIKVKTKKPRNLKTFTSDLVNELSKQNVPFMEDETNIDVDEEYYEYVNTYDYDPFYDYDYEEGVHECTYLKNSQQVLVQIFLKLNHKTEDDYMDYREVYDTQNEDEPLTYMIYRTLEHEHYDAKNNHQNDEKRTVKVLKALEVTEEIVEVNDNIESESEDKQLTIQLLESLALTNNKTASKTVVKETVTNYLKQKSSDKTWFVFVVCGLCVVLVSSILYVLFKRGQIYDRVPNDPNPT